MIYNMMQYLKNNFPSYNYAVNGFHDSTPNEAICINDTTSVPAKWIDRNDVTLQIFSRSESPLKAKKRAQEIFSILDRYFRVTLPSTVVEYADGSTETLAEVITYQIIPIQRPYWFGYDQNSRALYVFNIKVTTK